jgi:hypothetical protein
MQCSYETLTRLFEILTPGVMHETRLILVQTVNDDHEAQVVPQILRSTSLAVSSGD